MFGIFKRYRRLLSRDAAQSFNKMAAFLTNVCSSESIKFDRPDEPSADNPPCISVDKEWLKDFVENLEGIPSGRMGDAPATHGSFPSNEVTQQAGRLWSAGGTDGVRLLVLYKGEKLSGSVAKHDCYAVTLSFSKDGLLRYVDTVGNGGINILG